MNKYNLSKSIIARNNISDNNQYSDIIQIDGPFDKGDYISIVSVKTHNIWSISGTIIIKTNIDTLIFHPNNPFYTYQDIIQWVETQMGDYCSLIA